MSGVAKAVGKVFKKVTKVVKKVAPVVLAGAAIYFTAGAALGAAPLWGTAASQLVSQMGAQGVVANVLSGAVTQAGYGAATGGLVSAISGGDITKGVRRGALIGAATGGATGGLGLRTDPLSAQSAPQGASTGQAGAEVMAGTGDVARASAPAGVGAGAGAGGSSSAPGLFGQGGWLERNQQLVGTTVSGLGQGLAARAESADLTEREAARRRWIERNYGGGATPGYRPIANSADRFRGQYVYDPQQKRIVFVREDAA